MIRLRNKASAASQAVRPRGGKKAAESDSVLTRPVSQRTFLKILGSAAGLAGLAAAGQAAVAPRRAEATYIPGPPDTIDTSLTVQGNLTVNGPAGTNYTTLLVHNGDSASHAIVEGSGDGWNYGALTLQTLGGTRIWQLSHRAEAGVTNKLVFYYYNGATWISPLIIDTLGQVGIGVTPTTSKLDVGGAIAVSNVVAIDASGVAKQCYYAP